MHLLELFASTLLKLGGLVSRRINRARIWKELARLIRLIACDADATKEKYGKPTFGLVNPQVFDQNTTLPTKYSESMLHVRLAQAKLSKQNKEERLSRFSHRQSNKFQGQSYRTKKVLHLEYHKEKRKKKSAAMLTIFA
jgi:hypothetical protein